MYNCHVLLPCNTIGPRTFKSYTMCKSCFKYIARANYHDKRNCPNRKTLMDETTLLHLSLRMHWSKSTRWLLRRTLGLVVATEASYLKAREFEHNQIPKLYLCEDGHSVTANVDDTVKWMLTLDHIQFLMKGCKKITTIVGNDGARCYMSFVVLMFCVLAVHARASGTGAEQGQ